MNVLYSSPTALLYFYSYENVRIFLKLISEYNQLVVRLLFFMHTYSYTKRGLKMIYLN